MCLLPARLKSQDRDVLTNKQSKITKVINKEVGNETYNKWNGRPQNGGGHMEETGSPSRAINE